MKLRILGKFLLLTIILFVITGCDGDEPITPTEEPRMGTGFADYWYVDPAGNDDNDCHNPDTPCQTINEAIDQAVAGGTIVIAPGTYTEWYHLADTSVNISKDIILQGSGPDSTFIQSGNHANIILARDANVSISNLTIQNGESVVGHGIDFDAGRLSITNCVIQNNEGIGVFIWRASDVRLDRVTITGNQTGGIVISNRSDDASLVVTIRDSTISRNNGPGVVSRGRLIISDTTISYNQDGYVLEGFPAKDSGRGVINGSGVSYLGTGTATIERSTISNNRADFYDSLGTGIYNHGTMTLTNSTVSSNTGSGISNSGGNLTLIYSTIAENTSIGVVSGRTEFGGVTSIDHTTFENSLIANNGEQDCYVLVGVTFIGNNLDSDETCIRWFSSDRSHVDVHLEGLADNGGPTLTHALGIESPAVNSAEGDCPSTDQRGVGRPGGDECDVGAYEINIEESIVTTSMTCDGVQGVSIRDDGTMRTTVIVPGALGEYDATLNTFSITCLHYETYPNTILCDSPKPQGNTLATLIIFDDQGEEFCNETFSVPGPTTDQPDKDKGCTLSIQICTDQGLSFDAINCQCVEIQ